VNELGGSASVTVLDELDIVYIAHASLNRAIRLTAGRARATPSTPPRWDASSWRFNPGRHRRLLRAREPAAPDRAHRDRPGLAEEDPEGRQDQGLRRHQDELDYGIVSVALPIFGPHGRIVAAANCSDVTNRLDRDTMIKKRLPVLRQAVRRIEGMLTQHPELTHSVESIASDFVRTEAMARVAPPLPEALRARRLAPRVSTR
jgi:IclR family pca regulon transcriptional regulator